MNDESIKEAQQLCKDLELLCSQDDTLLEYIIDEYVYLLDDNRKIIRLISCCCRNP